MTFTMINFLSMFVSISDCLGNMKSESQGINIFPVQGGRKFDAILPATHIEIYTTFTVNTTQTVVNTSYMTDATYISTTISTVYYTSTVPVPAPSKDDKAKDLATQYFNIINLNFRVPGILLSKLIVLFQSFVNIPNYTFQQFNIDLTILLLQYGVNLTLALPSIQVQLNKITFQLITVKNS
jgi:hypothetical protein